MSDLINDTNESEEFESPNPVDEKSLLLERAKTMGLRVSGNIGLDALKAKIKEHMEGTKKDEELEKVVSVTGSGSYAERAKAIRKESLKLIRIRVVCMNPAKKDFLGEFFTVANKYIGNVKKFVPFGEATDNGYHVPYVIYKEMKNRKFMHKKTRRQNNIDIPDPENAKMMPEFNIEVLPQLTERELNDLKIQQARSGSTLDN